MAMGLLRYGMVEGVAAVRFVGMPGGLSRCRAEPALRPSGGAPNQCSVSGQRGDLADDQQRRRLHGVVRARARRVRASVPVTTRCSAREPFSTSANGVRGRAAVRDQALAQRIQPGHAHVDRQRLPFLRERAPSRACPASPCSAR